MISDVNKSMFKVVGVAPLNNGVLAVHVIWISWRFSETLLLLMFYRNVTEPQVPA